MKRTVTRAELETPLLPYADAVELGVGWSVPIGSIQRSPAHGIPGPGTDEFVFSLAGAVERIRGPFVTQRMREPFSRYVRATLGPAVRRFGLAKATGEAESGPLMRCCHRTLPSVTSKQLSRTPVLFTA